MIMPSLLRGRRYEWRAKWHVVKKYINRRKIDDLLTKVLESIFNDFLKAKLFRFSTLLLFTCEKRHKNISNIRHHCQLSSIVGDIFSPFFFRLVKIKPLQWILSSSTQSCRHRVSMCDQCQLSLSPRFLNCCWRRCRVLLWLGFWSLKLVDSLALLSTTEMKDSVEKSTKCTKKVGRWMDEWLKNHLSKLRRVTAIKWISNHQQQQN